MAGWFSKKDSEPQEEQVSAHRPYIIILGNEKGGSGKTTTSMHLIVSLLRLGFKVGSVDIDARQRSLSRYLENRRKTIADMQVSLPLPHHIIITKSPFNIVDEAEEDERERFDQARDRLKHCDFIVIDSPGNDTHLSRLAHSWADTVITPINDSFVDLDVLATVNGKDLKIIRPSVYSEMVWEQKLVRAKRDGGSLEWIVMRNRLSNIDARNKRYMKKVTEELSRRIGFRLAPGFSERVIFREMFLQGLTVLDVMEEGASRSVSLSHIAARQEVRDLLKTLRIPEIDRRVSELRQREEMEEDARSSAKEAPKPAAKPEPEVAKAAAQTSEAKAEEPATAAPAETAAAAETPAPSAQPAQQPAAATAAYHDNPMVRESSPLDYSTRQPASAGS